MSFVSGNSISGKSWQSFTVSDELLQKVVEATQAGEKEARTSGVIQSFEVFYRGFRMNLSLGRLFIIPPAVCNDRQDFPTALLYGCLVRIFGGEEMSDLIENKIGETEFDEYSQADFDTIKEKLFGVADGKFECLILFAPNWANKRDYYAFKFNKDEAQLKNHLRHEIFAAYYDPRLSSAFDAIMTNVNTTKIDVTDITPKMNFPFLAENVLVQYPDLQKQAGSKKKKIALTLRTAEAVTKAVLDPQELDVFDALNEVMGQALVPSRTETESVEEAGEEHHAEGDVPRVASKIAHVGADGKCPECQKDAENCTCPGCQCRTVPDATGFSNEGSAKSGAERKAPKCPRCKSTKTHMWGASDIAVCESCGNSGKIASIAKVAYVSHCPGHKNSKGESAQWCVKSHETGKILSSHTTEAAAKKHLQDMHAHAGSTEKEAGGHKPGCDCNFCKNKGKGFKKDKKDEKEDKRRAADTEQSDKEYTKKKKDACLEPAAHEAPFTNVGPGTEAAVAQEGMVKAVKEKLDAATDINEEKSSYPIGIGIDETGVARREEEARKVGGKVAMLTTGTCPNCDPRAYGPDEPLCPDCGSCADCCQCGGFERAEETPSPTNEWQGDTDHCKQCEATVPAGHNFCSEACLDAYNEENFEKNSANGDAQQEENDNPIQKAVEGVGSAAMEALPLLMANDKKAVRVKNPHSEIAPNVRTGDLSSSYSRAFHGGFSDKHSFPPKDVRAYLNKTTKPDQQPHHAMLDHATEIDAGKWGPNPTLKSAAQQIKADFIAEHIATDFEEGYEAASLKSKKAVNEREAKLDKLRPKQAVSLDIDSIWDEITEDMGPAPVVDIDVPEENTTQPTRPRKSDISALPEAMTSDSPEDTKAMSDSEADAQEDSMPEQHESQSESDEEKWHVSSSMEDFVKEAFADVESDEPQFGCDRCNMLSINGMATHELGCPNGKKTWVPGRGWINYLNCSECGDEVEQGETCSCQEESWYEEPDLDENGDPIEDEYTEEPDEHEASSSGGVVLKEPFQCQNCGHEGDLGTDMRCETCGSDAVISMRKIENQQPLPQIVPATDLYTTNKAGAKENIVHTGSLKTEEEECDKAKKTVKKIKDVVKKADKFLTDPKERAQRYQEINEELGIQKQEGEDEIKAMVASHPLTSHHEAVVTLFEHGQWWATCGACGAIWSVVNTDRGFDLEEVERGDDSCQENLSSHMSSKKKADDITQNVAEARAESASPDTVSSNTAPKTTPAEDLESKTAWGKPKPLDVIHQELSNRGWVAPHNMKGVRGNDESMLYTQPAFPDQAIKVSENGTWTHTDGGSFVASGNAEDIKTHLATLRPAETRNAADKTAELIGMSIEELLQAIEFLDGDGIVVTDEDLIRQDVEGSVYQIKSAQDLADVIEALNGAGLIVDDSEQVLRGAMRFYEDYTSNQGKTADAVQPDMAEAKSETVSPDTVDQDIQQPTESVEEAGKVSADISGDIAEAKAETDSPDTVDQDIQQSTESVAEAAKVAHLTPEEMEEDALNEGICPVCGHDDTEIFSTDDEKERLYCHGCGKITLTFGMASKAAAAGDNMPEEIAIDLGAGDLADIVMAEEETTNGAE